MSRNIRIDCVSGSILKYENVSDLLVTDTFIGFCCVIDEDFDECEVRYIKTYTFKHDNVKGFNVYIAMDV